MTKNYFAVERNGQCIENVFITKDDGTIAFEDVMEMYYDELVDYADLDVFVTCAMDSTNYYFNESDDSETIVTLVDEDGVFIWSVLIGPGDVQDELRYNVLDWRKDDKKFRYEK